MKLPIATLILVLLTVSFATPAPVPKEVLRPRPTNIVPGHYWIFYGGDLYSTTLDGHHQLNEVSLFKNEAWHGHWDWDESSRTLKIVESSCRRNFTIQWMVRLDNDLRGTTNGGYKVSFHPKRTP